MRSVVYVVDYDLVSVTLQSLPVCVCVFGDFFFFSLKERKPKEERKKSVVGQQCLFSITVNTESCAYNRSYVSQLAPAKILSLSLSLRL